MVNLTQICCKYMPFYFRRPEKRSVYFRRQAIFRLTGNYYGRTRNVWRVAIHRWLKKMVYLQEFRRRRNTHMDDLYKQRLLAAVEEHDFKSEYFLSTLTKCDVELDTRILSLLATYEPRTFKSLVDLTKTVFHENATTEISRHTKPCDAVITRGMLKENI
ncbi:mitochondrial ribosomal protein L20 [Dermatophagoides farinae]|uniref:39s ribosomal protein l20 n=1 Tax=Dermatophagoides farinae TaxID=6954 RepID=A0A9D4SGU3_DERFA|nr:50S ribosomal protein L20-like [Dermatophagoides farinae]KAH7641889.1 39s ribosomal protein l20 [Dermatophagoides farinae]